MSSLANPASHAGHDGPDRSTYDGPIFDCDSHIWERDYTFMRDYLPTELHDEWLVARRSGPEGYGLYIGNRRVYNSEANETGLVPPPGKLKDWLKVVKEGGDQLSGWMRRRIRRDLRLLPAGRDGQRRPARL